MLKKKMTPKKKGAKKQEFFKKRKTTTRPTVCIRLVDAEGDGKPLVERVLDEGLGVHHDALDGVHN